MLETKVTVLNEEGMHARPAGVLAKKASEFKSEITLEFNGVSKNAKSVLSLMSMGLTHGAEVSVKAIGDDAEKALQEITFLFANKFAL